MNSSLNIEEAKSLISSWKSSGEKVVFTNGVFDILHIGHVKYLSEASKLGSKLIVAVNSDRSTKMLGKGDDRPINGELDRAAIIANLKSVAAAVIFDEETPLSLIKELSPDVLVKGGDYNPEQANPAEKDYIVGSAEVRANGGEVGVIQFVEGKSTTNIIRKINSSKGSK